MQLHRHTSAAPDPRERGLDIGRIWEAQTRNTAKLYFDFFATLGIAPQKVRDIAEQSHAALHAWCPALAEEAEGWATGAGLETWEMSVVNARTEILAAAPRKVGSMNARRRSTHQPGLRRRKPFRPGTGMTTSPPTDSCSR